MKMNPLKTIIATGVAFLLGLICYTFAPESGYRNWISFAVASLSLAASLVMSLGIDYNLGNRNVNIKLVASIGTIITLISNFAFSFFEYSIPIYIAVLGIMILLTFVSIVGLSKKE